MVFFIGAFLAEIFPKNGSEILFVLCTKLIFSL